MRKIVPGRTGISIAALVAAVAWLLVPALVQAADQGGALKAEA